MLSYVQEQLLHWKPNGEWLTDITISVLSMVYGEPALVKFSFNFRPLSVLERNFWG